MEKKKWKRKGIRPQGEGKTQITTCTDYKLAKNRPTVAMFEGSWG